MYTGFEAHGFRCLSDLRVENLKRVNLIAGANNSGKTALLEALFLHCGGHNPHLVLSIAGLRSIESYKIESDRLVEPPWRSLFSGLNESREIVLRGAGCARAARTLRLSVPGAGAQVSLTGNGGASPRAKEGGVGTTTDSLEHSRSLRMTSESRTETGEISLFVEGNKFRTAPPVLPPPAFVGRFLAARWQPDFKEDAEFFGEVELENRQDSVIRVLRLIEPRLTRLSTIILGGQPMLHADVGLPRLIPVAFLGDGLLRVLRLVLNLMRSRDGVLLIDEVENGLHHSVLPAVWLTLAETARSTGTQLFATTHSRECVNAAHKAFSESFEYDLSLQRLERGRDGEIRAVAYDREALEGALMAGFEVR